MALGSSLHSSSSAPFLSSCLFCQLNPTPLPFTCWCPTCSYIYTTTAHSLVAQLGLKIWRRARLPTRISWKKRKVRLNHVVFVRVTLALCSVVGFVWDFNLFSLFAFHDRLQIASGLIGDPAAGSSRKVADFTRKGSIFTSRYCSLASSVKAIGLCWILSTVLILIEILSILPLLEFGI